MKKQNTLLLWAAASLLMVTGCMEKELLDPAEDNSIRFGVSTVYENYGETRTEYTGKNEDNDVITNTSQYERINWLNSDKIRVISAETNGTNLKDFSVTPNSDKSTASVDPEVTGFFWNNNVTDHYFYALYPSPAQNGAPSGASIAASTGNKATIHGSIPEIQTGEWVASSRMFKPNMNYAYMYAAKKQSKGNNPTPESTHVTLEFKPLVTAIEFSLVADSHFPADLPLTKVELTSATTNLAGDFTATLDATTSTGLSDNPSVTGGSSTLTINLPSVALSTTDATTFTFLALPVEQKDLTLKLTFTDGTRSLVLATSDGNIIVGARKKLYIRSLGVKPEAVYHLSVKGPEAHETLNADGTDTGHYTVVSYVEYKMGTSVVTEAVPWSAEFSVDGGKNWSTTPEGWTVPDPSGPGSVTGEEKDAKAGVNTTQIEKKWEGSTASVATSKTAAVDLSYRNYKGEPQSKQSTANCYIVSAPGWYKIPLVYGSAITNDVTITDCYSNFLRHDGNPIRGPWITTDNLTTVDEKAVLCWQDNNAISTSDANGPSVDGDYLYFRVRSGEQYLKQGNAVIAVTKDGTVVWSWHIWLIEPSKLETMTIGSNQMLNHNLGWYDADQTIPERKLMIRVTQNISNKEDSTQIIQNANDVFGGNVFYQWGRKDPMVGADGNYNIKNTTGTHPFETKETAFRWSTKTPDYPATQKARWGLIDVNIDSNINGVKIVDQYYMETRFQDAITHPWLLYYPEKDYTVPNGIKDWTLNKHGYELIYGNWTYDANQATTTVNSEWRQFYDGKWYKGRYLNLWNANAQYDTDNNVEKTVYDPSPAGFKVPNRNAFDALVDMSINDLGWGYAVKTSDGKRMTFPRVALRDLDGDLRDDDYSGENEVFIWTASLHPYASSAYTDSGDYLQWNGFGGDITPEVHVQLGPEAYAMSVRPIVDTNH